MKYEKINTGTWQRDGLFRFYIEELRNVMSNIGSCLPNNKMDIKLFGGLLGVRATRCCRCLSCNRYEPLAVCP